MEIWTLIMCRGWYGHRSRLVHVLKALAVVALVSPIDYCRPSARLAHDLGRWSARLAHDLIDSTSFPSIMLYRLPWFLLYIDIVESLAHMSNC
jgi:hypothetical protein